MTNCVTSYFASLAVDCTLNCGCRGVYHSDKTTSTITSQLGCVLQFHYMYHLKEQQKRFDGLFVVWFWLAEIKKKKKERKTHNKIHTGSQRTQNRQKLDDAWFFISKLTTKLQYRNHTVLPWKLASQTNGIVQKCIMWSKGYWQEWKFSTWKKIVCKNQYPEARDMHEAMTWLLT